MESPFASWMERLHLEDQERAIPDKPSDELTLIANTGNQREKAYLKQLKESGRDVCEILRNRQAHDLTLETISSRREIIFQGDLKADQFAGCSDFLVLGADGLYEVWDTKLARKVKPYFLIQLCCYAEMLEIIQGRRPEYVCVVLGDNATRSTFRDVIGVQSLTHVLHRPTTLRRTQKFPEAASRRMVLPSSASATSFFRRAFSRSSCFRRFA